VVVALLVGLGAAAKLGVVPLPGSAIIKENFSSPNGHWVERSDGLVQAGFVDGTYQILIRAPQLDFESYRGAADTTWASIRVEADARKADATTPEGAYGVSCVVDQHTGYVFILDPDAGSLAIVRVQNSNRGAIVQQMTDLTAMSPGSGTNRIQGEGIQAIGGATSLTMSVNGKQVLQASDPNGLTGFTGIGLWAATRGGGTDVRFDNAVMHKA